MDDRLEALKEHAAARYERLEESKAVGPLVNTTKRFFEIEGLDLAGLLALELFTTIIPLVLLGYSWASGFNSHLNFGDFMIKWMELKGQSASIVHDLFGDSARLKDTWTFLGIAGFLFWGVPMSAQVAKTFARAFRRERWSFMVEVGRGTVWFGVLLASQIGTVVVGNAVAGKPPLNVLAWIPSFVLWSVSPLVLVRNGTNGWKHMIWCGLAGVVLDLIGVRITLRWVFPKLLEGWVGFGPIGVAMAMMTTCTVIATLWVITACLGAVLWERNAPADTVINSQYEPMPGEAAARK